MNIDNPTGTDDDSPLSLGEAVEAYADMDELDEPVDDGQSEGDDDAQGDAPDQEPEEGEDDTEGQEDEPQEEDGEEDPDLGYADDDLKIRLKDGTETTVAQLRSDLEEGGMRLQDYRRKTEEVANERRQLEGREQQLSQFEQQSVQEREFLIEVMQQFMPQEPHPSEIANDPIGYGERKAWFDHRRDQMANILNQQEAARQRANADRDTRLKEHRAQEWTRTLEKLPELKDEKHLQSFVNDIREHGTAYGYTPEELSGIGMDHRQIPVLRDAIAWRKLQASKPKVSQKVQGKPAVQRGSARQSPQLDKARSVKAAMDRLNSSGSLRDGVAALMALEEG